MSDLHEARIREIVREELQGAGVMREPVRTTPNEMFSDEAVRALVDKIAEFQRDSAGGTKDFK